MRGLFVLSLLGIGICWSFAWLAPKAAEPPPPMFRGVFELVGVELDEGMPLPFPARGRATVTFADNGTYLIRSVLSNGEELYRQQGVAKFASRTRIMSLPVEIDGRKGMADMKVRDLAMVQESVNLTPSRKQRHLIAVVPPQPADPIRLVDEVGGYRLLLRPSDDAAGPAPGRE